MTGKYSAKRDGRLILKGGGMTEMAGDPAAMKAEEVFMKLFSGVTHWRVKGKALVLSNGTPELELRFQVRAPVKAKPLTGTVWSLEGFEERGKKATSDTALVAGTTITLSIDGLKMIIMIGPRSLVEYIMKRLVIINGPINLIKMSLLESRL